MRRVLTDGGRVVLSVWRDLQRHPVYEALFEATTRHLGAALSDVALSFSLWDAEELRALLSDAGFQRTEVTPRSLDIHLPSPERFVQLTVLGAATSVPAFAQLDAAACARSWRRSHLRRKLSRNITELGTSWFFRCSLTSRLHARSWLAEVSHHTTICPRMSQAKEGDRRWEGQ